MHLYNCRCFQEHLRTLLQSLRSLCKAPGWPESIWKYIQALLRSPGVSRRIACGFWTDLHCADSKSKKLPNDENRVSKVSTESSKENHQTAEIPWSHPKRCSWSLCRLRLKCCCCWGCDMATRAQSHYESSCYRLPCELETYKLPLGCKLVDVRIECTGWTVVQGFVLWVGISLAVWRVDGWVIISSVLGRFWVCFWDCFIWLFHHSHSCKKGCVESSQCWE